MIDLSYTLLSDGSSDRALIPIINWLLRNHLSDCAIEYQWADLRRLDKSLKNTFEKRIQMSIDLYPCDLLFIHRDAEKEPHEYRVSEIQSAISKLSDAIPPTVCVMPVRMTEAWLLSDISALRKAASNPNGKVSLSLPILKKIEDEPDPKKILNGLLREASELSSQRLKRFSESERVHRLSELTTDFSLLRILPSFLALESEIKCVIQQQNWK